MATLGTAKDFATLAELVLTKKDAGERDSVAQAMSGLARLRRRALCAPVLKALSRYDTSGFRGQLLVEEPSNIHHVNSNYRWDLRFNDDKPLDLIVHFGAGEGRLDVGELHLRSLEIHMGVGELRVDLRGMPKNDYDVSIHGGIGEATIYLPEGVGVVAEAHGGIGGINARGLEKRDDRYVNDAYGHSKTTVRLEVHGGIGAINLVGG